MALKRGGSNSADVVDVMALLEAFEEMNGCRVSVEMMLTKEGGIRDLWLQATAWERGGELPDPKVLTSVNATCSAINLRSLDAAVIRILYTLDGKLAWQGEVRPEVKKQ